MEHPSRLWGMPFEEATASGDGIGDAERGVRLADAASRIEHCQAFCGHDGREHHLTRRECHAEECWQGDWPWPLVLPLTPVWSPVGNPPEGLSRATGSYPVRCVT